MGFFVGLSQGRGLRLARSGRGDRRGDAGHISQTLVSIGQNQMPHETNEDKDALRDLMMAK